jgi:hypothetical protein
MASLTISVTQTGNQFDYDYVWADGVEPVLTEDQIEEMREIVFSPVWGIEKEAAALRKMGHEVKIVPAA